MGGDVIPHISAASRHAPLYSTLYEIDFDALIYT